MQSALFPLSLREVLVAFLPVLPTVQLHASWPNVKSQNQDPGEERGSETGLQDGLWSKAMAWGRLLGSVPPGAPKVTDSGEGVSGGERACHFLRNIPTEGRGWRSPPWDGAHICLSLLAQGSSMGALPQREMGGQARRRGSNG